MAYNENPSYTIGSSITATQYDVLVGGAANAVVSVGPGSAGQVLQSAGNAANPAYSTATYPATAGTSGKILISDGTNLISSTPTFPNSATGTGKILIADGTNWVASTPTYPNASASSGKIIISDGTNFIASTPTFPNSASSTGTILRADGTNWVATTSTYPATNAISTILYASAINVMSALATANNGTFVTSSTGVPSILAGPGTTGNILQANAAAPPSFSSATYPVSTTVSQILYSSATNVVSGLTTGNDGVLITSHTGVPSLLAGGTTGQVLTATTNSPPTWAAASAGTITGPGSSTDNALVRWDGTTGVVIQNSVITEDDTGNLVQTAAVSGGSLSVISSNTSNTASATAFHECIVAGTTAADAYFRSTITGGQAWTWGGDNSDSDAFVISANTALGTSNVMRVATTGEITYPLQSAFLAFLATTDTNCTGDGTNFVMGSGNALTEVFDQNSDFVTTGTYTCPVTSKVCLNATFYVIGGTVITGSNFFINTSNRNYRTDSETATGTAKVKGISTLADMDAADTATFSIAFSDSGGKVDDLFGSTTPLLSWCSGYIAC